MVAIAALGAMCLTPGVVRAEDDASAKVAIDGPVAASSSTPLAENAPIPTRDLWDIIRSGGPLMIPLGVCSLLLLAFVFERMIALRQGRIIPKPFVRRIIEQIREGDLDRNQALELCEQNGSPVSEVFGAAVRRWGRPAVEVEQAIIDAGERVTNGLRRYLRVINGVATISPLLGLLGTVVGMIRAFNAIATTSALGRPELLANGISEALLTTAAGLTVAIPALFFYMFFVSRVDRLIIDIDALGQQLVTMISAEELDNRNKVPAPAHTRRNQKVST
ncbi:MAG: MotA/TolQ/ExbB proton channel family protein [Pirellulales bacterium]|nr:MotA/TolQ/ExbB proton channel family protein [Pirellulales bacterium]